MSNWRTKNIVTEYLSEKSLTEIKLHAHFEQPGLKNANHYKRKKTHFSYIK